MKRVSVDEKLKKRIEVVEAQFHTAKAFADEMGVETSAVRHWKTRYRDMSVTALHLFERIEKEKLKSKQHKSDCKCDCFAAT